MYLQNEFFFNTAKPVLNKVKGKHPKSWMPDIEDLHDLGLNLAFVDADIKRIGMKTQLVSYQEQKA